MANEIMDMNFYNQIKEILSSARAKVYSAANFAMVEAYWEIGRSIVEKQGGNATAEYGASLLKELSKQMTADFGKGFTVTNLSYMRQFYLTFPNHHTLCDKLSSTSEFIASLVVNTFPNALGNNTVPPEWEIEQPERFKTVVEELNSKSTAVWKLFCNLVNLARKILAV